MAGGRCAVYEEHALAPVAAADRASVEDLGDAEVIALVSRGRRLRRTALLILIDRARGNPSLRPALATAFDDLDEDDRRDLLGYLGASGRDA